MPTAGTTCPRCAAVLPTDARFCPACGAPSVSQPTERRVVTVVFADLAGFTSMAEGRDPEAVKELLDSCFGRLVPVIEVHGGTVDKIIGDELMAVFGAPRAHEDDPERAVRAALGLIDALEQLDPALEMRVGINTGEVLAGPVGPGGAYTVTGDTVNTAHRLVGVARRGSVMVAERTHAATADAIAYGAPASLRLRGRQEPVVAHRALRVRHRRPEGRSTSPTRPLVGRDAPLAELLDVVSLAFTRQEPELVVVVGEAGVGKSRLVAELGSALTERHPSSRTVVVTCTPYATDGPLAPLAGLVRAVLDVPDRASADQQRVAVMARLQGLALPARTRARLGARTLQLLGLSDHPAVHAGDTAPGRHTVADDLAAAARALLEVAIGTDPLLAVLEDAHHADPLVLDQLERVPSWAGDLAISVVAVGRDDALAQRTGLLDPRSRRHRVLRLPPLSTEASRALLHLTLAEVDGVDGTLGATVEEQILAAAGGNPLLLDQLVRFLRESGHLERVEGGWRAVGPLDQAGLPDGARAVLGARLDALPDRERALLQDAAVVGTTFGWPALVALGQEPDEDLATVLQERGLLRTGSDPGVLEFRHAMVRDAAYASVSMSRRCAGHAALARWMVTSGDDDQVGPVAHHLERAVSLQRDLGAPPDDEIDEMAAAYLLAAARTARARDELREADRWYRRIGDLALTPTAETVAVRLEHGSVLLELRRLADADAAYRSVADTGPAGSPAVAEAHTGLGLVHRLRGDVEGANRWFESARIAWQVAQDPTGEARAVRTQGWAEVMAGRPRAALATLVRARELEAATGPPSGQTLQSLAWCEYLIGDHLAARQHLWEAAQALTLPSDRAALGWCFAILGNSFWQEGRVEQARTIAENLLRATSGEAEPWGEGMCLVLLAVCLLEGGEQEVARDTALAALRAFAELDDPWGDAMARLALAMAHRVGGDLRAAIGTLERGLGTAQKVAAVGSEARLRAELAAALLDTGDEAGAEREAQATLALVRTGSGDRDSEIRALVVLAKRARLLGHDEAVTTLLEEATRLAPEELRTSIWRRAAALASIEAAEHGALARARSLAADAREGSWESARTWVLAQRARAAVQDAEGARGEARATLAEVMERFGDRPLAFVSAARADLERLMGRPHEEAGAG